MYQNRICQDCLTQGLGISIKRKCYNQSALLTFLMVRMLRKAQAKGVWDNHIDAYIALTQFGKNIFTSNGLPPEKVYVKPNVLMEKPAPPVRATIKKRQALFVGRLPGFSQFGPGEKAWG